MSEDADKKRIAELEERIKVLERQINPPPRKPQPARLEGFAPSTYRLIDQMSIPKHLFDEYVANVSEETIKQLRTDGKK
jgi:hypothetical protein